MSGIDLDDWTHLWSSFCYFSSCYDDCSACFGIGWSPNFHQWFRFSVLFRQGICFGWIKPHLKMYDFKELNFLGGIVEFLGSLLKCRHC